MGRRRPSRQLIVPEQAAELLGVSVAELEEIPGEALRVYRTLCGPSYRLDEVLKLRSSPVAPSQPLSSGVAPMSVPPPPESPKPAANAWMNGAAAAADAASFPPDIPTSVPTPARTYGWLLGGKDNFPVDRRAVLTVHQSFPEMCDIARQNRQFLYRAVRFLAREAGITQFLDLGSGLPTENNVHQVAQHFQPQARVVYVDNDPIVLAHGRALLADNPQTAVAAADMTDPKAVLDHEETRRLINFTQPVAVLMLSIPHCIPDDAAALRAIHGPLRAAAPGSYLAISHVVADTAAMCEEVTEAVTAQGMAWKTRTPADVAAWLEGLEPVEPGLGDINHWRPDPHQPPLSDLDPVLEPYLGASQRNKRVYEYGGVLRKPTR